MAKEGMAGGGPTEALQGAKKNRWVTPSRALQALDDHSPSSAPV